MISNRCARKSLVTNCNSIISKNYLRFLVDSNDLYILLSRLSILAQCKGNKYIRVSINALCMNEDILQNN